MKDVYVNDIYPYWWKIAGIADQDEWAKATSVMEFYDPDCRIIILGQGADAENLSTLLTTAKQSHHTVGFAIGRTIFWDAWVAFANNEMTAEEVPAVIADNYRKLIGIWQNA